MVEAWYAKDNEKKFFLESDCENAYSGLDHYPRIAGAYFAAKLAMLEYLTDKRRKCSVLVFREIRPEYLVPLGVWQIREGIRDALRTKKVTTPSSITNSFSDFRKALLYAVKGMTVPVL